MTRVQHLLDHRRVTTTLGIRDQLLAGRDKEAVARLDRALGDRRRCTAAIRRSA